MLRESRSRPLAQLRNSSGGVAPDTAAAKMSVRVIRFDVAYAPKLWPHSPNLPLREPHLADRVHRRHDALLERVGGLADLHLHVRHQHRVAVADEHLVARVEAMDAGVIFS